MRTTMCIFRRVLLLTVLVWMIIAALPAAGQTQEEAAIIGTVTDLHGLALSRVAVILSSNSYKFVASAMTDRTGSFTISNISAGNYILSASLLGFASHEERMHVGPDGATVTIRLEVGSFRQEITVSALMPEVATELVITAREIERRVARDLAQSLRDHAGVTALRRGPVNLDPSVRGLYAEQIAVFVDGTRTIAAGPARMDSGLSHVSPHALQSLRVVRGPYALTWGSGALSAIRADTFKPAFSGSDLHIGGRAGYNYGSNGASNDGLASLYGSSDRLRFSLQHNIRTGNDYRDGHRARVEGDYQSFDTRWSLGGRLSQRTTLDYSGGYQKQNNIDYPGRILDATFFETLSHALDLSYRPVSGLVSQIAGQFYLNSKSHAMNNVNKPTARPMVGRTPPFAINVDLPASADTIGGRFHVALEGAGLRYKVGLDTYRLLQSATRTIKRRETGQILHSDLVWPNAKVTNSGGYAQLIYDRDRSSFGATVRIDHEQTQIGNVSRYFADNAIPAYELHQEYGRFRQQSDHGLEHSSGDREETGHGRTHAANVSGDAFAQTNVNVSGAVNTSLRITDTWLVTLGAGRAVRSPSVLERYSDRFPAVKFQTAAEFVGNPLLVPEKSFELNAGMMFRVGRAIFDGDVFHRTIDDYITVAHDPNLMKRLPLSPTQVFRYIQANAARFVGFDLRAESDVGPWLSLRAGWSLVRADDLLIGEPIFGIPPFEQRYALDIHTPSRTRWVELQITHTGKQDRVATRRFELATPGWTTIDLLAGWLLSDGLTLRAGIQNLTGEFYVNHLNSINPFTGQRIAEVGRSGYVGLEFGF